jgi:hypothetical protein
VRNLLDDPYWKDAGALLKKHGVINFTLQADIAMELGSREVFGAIAERAKIEANAPEVCHAN